VCPCGAVIGLQVVEGEGVYKYGAVGNYYYVFTKAREMNVWVEEACVNINMK